MPPTVADVERIAALEDPVLRNLRITLAYSELSAEVDRLTGGDDLNWCGFATWASKQVGRTIRQRDLVRLFERLLGERSQVIESLHHLRLRIGRHLAEEEPDLVAELAPTASFERAASASAEGNLKVFDEVGREFARYLAELAAEERYSADRVRQFVDSLREGPPPAGQAPLRHAFAALHRARFADDAKERAELMLLTNLHLGLHEQTRLQPQIRSALDAPVVDARELRRRVLERLLPSWSQPLSRLRHLYLALTAPLDRSWGRLTEAVRQTARSAVTGILLTLELPRETVRLGENLRRRPEGPLATLDSTELAELLVSLDPDPDSARGSGAEDWSVLGDRMHFIAEFFRAYQRERSLREPPFSPAQVAAIERGEVPEGPL